MKGSIRFFLGMLIAFGAVGGIENSMNNSELLQATLVAFVGIALMYSGSNSMKED